MAVIAAHERTVTRSAPPPPVEIELVGPSPAPPWPEPPAAAGGSPAEKAPAPRAASRVRAIAPKAQRRSAAAEEVTMRIEPPGTATDAAGEAGGREGGLGDGQGRGIGFGAGRGDADAAVAALAVPTPDLVPRASQARPPTLIYPRRNRDIEDERLFVARLTIDGDGFVVGAHLVGGRGSPGAERAASAVWRFRYRPALDAAGRPITVTIDQRLLVDH